MLRRGDERGAGPATGCSTSTAQVLVLRSDMTIPIARVVATRYAEPSRRSGSATSRTPTGRWSARGQAREFLQGGLELIGMPAPDGDAEVLGAAVRGARGRRADRAPARASATARSTARCSPSSRCRGRSARAARGAFARDLVGGGGARGASSGSARARQRAAAALPSCAAAPRCSSGAASRCRRGGEPARAATSCCAERGVADRVIFDLGLVRELGYYTGAVFEVYDPAVGFASAAAAATTTCSGASAGRCPPAASRSTCSACTWRRRRGEEGGPRADGLMIAVPRGALFGETLDLLDALGIDTRRGALERPQLGVPRGGLVTMRPSDVPTYVEHGAADIGITGKDVLLEQAGARGLRAARPGLRQLPDGRGRARRRRRARRSRCGGSGVGPDRHQVPADRDAPLRATPAARRRSWR